MKEVLFIKGLIKRRAGRKLGFLLAFLAVCFLFGLGPVAAQKLLIEKKMHYLQSGQRPEWNEFAKHVPEKIFSANFSAQDNQQEQTLRIRQYDVKQPWKVLLNERLLGNLTADENDLNIYLPIPKHALLNGENNLRIEPAGSVSDDVLVGEVWLEDKPLQEVLSECTLSVQLRDKVLGVPLPSRLTLINSEGALQTIGATSDDTLAVRPGFVYTSTGRAAFTLPEGTYTVHASRGFEYSVDSARLVLSSGQGAQRDLFIQREVSTKEWISSDTHLHTLTYSGHGDATIKERLLAIAGEGIELPVITEHNLIVDVRPLADSLHLTPYFTPVAGAELTTPVGHFNLFPLSPASSLPDPSVKSWNELSGAFSETSDKRVVILNHGRDIHKGFRPFDVKIHLALAGQRLDQQPFPANAMEVINSGSQQTDKKRLLFDWFGMLNRGYFLTPVGSSDSHDVARYLAGQARTYIKGRDDDAGKIRIAEAIENLRKGRVMVSFGLLTEILVDGYFGPGEMAPAKDKVRVSVTVSGPGWAEADRVALYANGKKVVERAITNARAAGVKWEGSWVLPRLKHDVFLVAVAEGPGRRLPFWPIAKPYQPASPHWEPGLIRGRLGGYGWQRAAYKRLLLCTGTFS
jgi:hypothetical protein